MNSQKGFHYGCSKMDIDFDGTINLVFLTLLESPEEGYVLIMNKEINGRAVSSKKLISDNKNFDKKTAKKVVTNISLQDIKDLAIEPLKLNFTEGEFIDLLRELKGI